MKVTYISLRKEFIFFSIVVYLKIFMSDNDIYVFIDWNFF